MALVLIVLLGFAAIAIDLAHKWSLQRQDQSASDTGVFAGALFTVNKDGPTAIAGATTEVVRITYSTAQPNLTFAEWQTAYVNCVDANKPAEYTRTGTSQCVSFTNNLEKIRVRLPNVDFDTTFGPVLGVGTISTSAAAEARIRLVAAGNVLPFGLPGSAAAGEVCLKTGANPKNIVPCDGPDNGNFAFLDITQMGNFDMQTSTTCTGNTTGRLAENIAIGVDHDIGTAPMETSPFMRDRDLCPAFASTPYTLQTETGNMASALDDGFANGVNGRLGRLVDTPFANTDVAGHEIDHKPLWEFITDNAEVPGIEGWFLGHEGGVCSAASMSSKADMLLCLAAWDQTDADQLDNAYGPSRRRCADPVEPHPGRLTPGSVGFRSSSRRRSATGTQTSMSRITSQCSYRPRIGSATPATATSSTIPASCPSAAPTPAETTRRWKRPLHYGSRSTRCLK